MKYGAIATFVLLISAALPAEANELNGSGAGDGFAIRSEPAQAAEHYYQFAQRTPAVPPEPECDVRAHGTGAWTDGDIIPSGSATGSCTQKFKCDAKPGKDERPNAACGFQVHHTDDIMRNGECRGKDCKSCVHDPIKDKCEWWVTKGK